MRQFFRRNEQIDTFSNRLLGGVAIRFFRRRVPGDDPGLRGHVDYGVVRSIDECSECRRLGLGTLTLGEIAMDCRHPEQLPAGVPDPKANRPNVYAGAVLAQTRHLEAVDAIEMGQKFLQ